jgi:hypothetical protein
MDWQSVRAIGCVESRANASVVVTILGGYVELRPLPMSLCGLEVLEW